MNKTPGPYSQNLNLYITYECDQHAVVFVLGNPFQPDAMKHINLWDPFITYNKNKVFIVPAPEIKLNVKLCWWIYKLTREVFLRGRLSTVDLLVLNGLDQLILMTFLHKKKLFFTKNSLNEEVNCTEPSLKLVFSGVLYYSFEYSPMS